MVKLKVKKYTLKPIEAELKQIRKRLQEDCEMATGEKKKSLCAEVKKMDKLLALLVVTCKHHTMG